MHNVVTVQKETLGFVFKPGQQNVAANRNVESESWIDCRDVMEEKLQAQKFTVRSNALYYII
jgi:hypothetical protein